LITFDQVTKIYPGGVKAVSNLDMQIAEGHVVVLLGTSGSGKTTALKMVNRLIEPSSGRILIDGVDIFDQNPIVLRRKIGYAIQHIGLFPHMTIEENLAVVPRLLNWPKDRISDRIDELLNMVDLNPEEFRLRYPNQLSGGQQQRVGVARALAADPPIILMDEPFGALDPITRDQLQNEFIELKKRIRKTVIFVTHDIFEAVKIGDLIALLDAGELQQMATGAELIESPANEFVDQFLGAHRFQLLLLTKPIRSVLDRLSKRKEILPDKESGVKLKADAPFVEALEIFKKTGLKELPVYEGEKFIGNLEKKRLLEAITSALEQ
jgi:osmoprotectant transport system ATP-binding protein